MPNLSLSRNLPITRADFVNSLLMKRNKQVWNDEYPDHDASVRARFNGLLCAILAHALRVKMSETVSGREFTEQGEQGFST